MKKSLKRMVSFLLVLSVVASLILVGAPSVYARQTAVKESSATCSLDEGWLPDGVYEIYSAVNPNYAWDIAGGSNADNVNLQLYSVNHSNAQRFVVQRLDNKASDGDWYSIRALCSYNAGNHTYTYVNAYTSGDNVGQWDTEYKGDQTRWYIHYSGKVNLGGASYETFSFESKLFPTHYAGAAGTPGLGVNVQQTTISTPSAVTNNERWILKPVNVLSGDFTFQFKGESMDIKDGASTDGANVQMWDTNYTDAQRYTITPTSDGYATISAFCSGRFVCAAGASDHNGIAEGTDVIQYGSYTDSGTLTDNTKWSVIPNADGTYSFCNYYNGLYLDVYYGASKANIQCWYANNSEAQKWTLTAAKTASTSRSNAVNGNTGIYSDSYKPDERISIPIEIYDYDNDGMLFEYAEDQTLGSIQSYVGGSVNPTLKYGVDFTRGINTSIIAGHSAFLTPTKVGTAPEYYYLPWKANSATTGRPFVYTVDFGGAAKASVRYMVIAYRTDKATNQLGVYLGTDQNQSSSSNYATGDMNFTVDSSSDTRVWRYQVYDLRTGNLGANWNNFTTANVAWINYPMNASGQYIDITHLAFFPSWEAADEYGKAAVAFDNNPGTKASLDMGNNRAFGLLRGSNGGNWESDRTNPWANGWQNGYTSKGIGYEWPTNNQNNNNYYGQTGGIYQVNCFSGGSNIDMSNLPTQLGYTLYATMTKGLATVGLTESALGENGTPVYKEKTVAYVAQLLRDSLGIAKQANNNNWQYNFIQGKSSSRYGNMDLASALRARIPVDGNTAKVGTHEFYTLGTYADTLRHKSGLIGTWEECKGNIKTCYDAAYFLLNNMFTENSYNTPKNTYNYLVLTQATTTDGRTGYLFDAGFTDNTSPSIAQSAVAYDAAAGTISNSSMAAKTCYIFGFDSSTTLFPFLPITDQNNSAGQTRSPYVYDPGVPNMDQYGGNYTNRDFNYVLRSHGKFQYWKDDALFFEFEGDDDVYMYINGELVLDIGGAHSVTGQKIDLNTYVAKAQEVLNDPNATAAEKARAEKLNLQDGQEYTFDFFYAERHGYGANMRIFTNMKIVDTEMKAEKEAWQNGEQLSEGATIAKDELVEYGFSITNTATLPLSDLKFYDAKLTVKIDYTEETRSGLTVSDTKHIVDANGGTLDVSDLIVEYTNESGWTATKRFETNAELCDYLDSISLKTDETLRIRGIYVKNIGDLMEKNKFLNTVYAYATASNGKNLESRDDMWVFTPSEPSYYEWAGHDLTVSATKLVGDAIEAAKHDDNPLYGMINALTQSNFSKIEVCTAGGNTTSNRNLTISGSGTNAILTFNYPSTGSFTSYVKVTYGNDNDKNDWSVVIPVQTYVTAVNDSVFVLDYGLKADLGEVMKETDNLTVPGRSTNYKFETTTTSVPFYSENHIILPTGENAEFNGVFEVHSAANDNIIWELPCNYDGTRVIQTWTNSYTANSKLFYIYPDTLHPGYYRIMSYSKATYLTRIHDNNLTNAIDKNGNPRNEDGYVALTGYSAEETGQYWKITKNADGTVSFTSRFDETVQGRTPYQLTLLNADGNGFNDTNENPVNFLRAWKEPNSVDAKYRSFKLVATVAPIAGTSYGNYVPNELSDKNVTLDYQPTKFMEGADSVYAAVRVYEGTASDAIGTVNINTEVEMYKQITVLPANVVYYEDDFPMIKYYGNNDGNTKNTFTTDGTGSGSLYQSADQSTQYGFDDVYGTGTTMSGNSGHVIEIKNSNVAAEFTFVGTGFELIGRSTESDDGVIYLDVLNSAGTCVKRIPVILEYNDVDISSQTEGIYQVPIVRVDGLEHGKYTVQIHGVPTTVEGAKRILFIDGVRIYNPLADTDPNREYYIDGEDTAEFLEIRNLILKGKAAVVSLEENETTGALELTTNTSTYTENRNGVTYPVNTFKLKSVQYGGYFVDAETKTGAEDYPPINLRTDATVIGNNQFVFTFAKTENNTDYYYIHIYSGGHERYLKRSAVPGNADIMLVSKENQNPATMNPDCFLWKITSLDKAQNIVTIQSKHDSSYLSVATVNASAKTGTIQAVSIGTITDAQKWELGAIASKPEFIGNIVNSVNDYLVFGPNNELYLDGESQSQALAFYFTPDGNTTTTTMLQVGVHVLNDQRLQGDSGDLTTPGKLYQSANQNGIAGWKTLDENIQTSTEGYYPIDLSLCKYDEALNRYEVVLYCGGGYLSFTNLKVSGGTIETITGETADLRYNNGVLELLTTVGAANMRTWVPVEHPENYPDFASLSKQMRSTTMYELDADTGEFVPVLIESDAKVALAGRSLLFKDIIKMRFYFDISATGVTTATPENSGLLVWTEEEYAAFDSHTVDNAGKKLRGLTYSVNGYYADTQGIPAKNMVDKLYVRAYVILPDGSYEYSDITEFSPVMYAQIILDKETSSETMKELVIALMNYGAAAQKRFNYKTDELMNAWLPAEQQTVAWSDEWINALPTDTSKFTFDANEQITMVGSSVTFVGAVNQNFYFNIPAELTQNATKIELLYWTESEYEALTEMTVANAHRVDYDLANGRAVIEGTAAKNLGNACYLVLHIENEDGDVFSGIFIDSAHDYARRVLASASTSDAMKELARTLVIYSNKAKAQLGG